MHRLNRTLLPIWLALFGAAVWLDAPHASAAEPEWKVGLAAVKITPEQPVLMSGYAGRDKPFAKVTADLYAKAIVIEDAQGRRAALVTSDLLGLPRDVAEPICAAIAKKTGIQREFVLLNSSHTHAGPLLAVKAPVKGITGADLRTVEYTRWLEDRVVDAVVKASQDLAPAKLLWSSGVVDFVMNRREFTPRGVILGVNPRGLADRTVPVLRIEDASGKLRAILFGAACHGTTLGPNNYQICGDFAGFAQALIQERHPNVQAMFMIGCAGDANPYPRGTMELARKHGKALADEVERVLGGKFQPVRGPLKIAFAKADLPLAALTKPQIEKLAAEKRGAQGYAAGEMLAMLKRGETPPSHYTCPFTVWQFGQDLTLVGLPGEVVVDYAARLEKALGPNKLWLSAYCNDVFGYLPSARVLAEGGYETRGLYSGSAGIFDPKVEDVVVEKVTKLAREVGRVR